MFKKSPKTKQFDLFFSPSELMCDRESRLYGDVNAWHNKFYQNVTSKIDEDVFKPLFKEGNMGAPNASIRILIAMSILKEGCGCSDEQLYERCRYDLLFRRALGLIGLDEQCPSIDTYYCLRRRICEYDEEHSENLFEKCFKQVTGAQAKEYRISGKTVRMDSKLISSNIAWYSRYEIIHETFLKCVGETEINKLSDQMIRQQGLAFLSEDAAKTVYNTESDTLADRLLCLGIVISHLLAGRPKDEVSLLSRVFHEQYDVQPDGTITVRDKKLISASSLQNPNDPDATYRSKTGKKVKGYNTNITETTDSEGTPELITDVKVKPANAADNSFLEDAVKATEEVTGDKVEAVHADGAYQSEGNRELAADPENGFDFIANGIQGKIPRFELNLQQDGQLEVTDKKSGEIITAIPVGDNRWKIPVLDKEGKRTHRYFGKEQIDKSKLRREVESIPFEQRKKRNNVEATIFQYCFHTRNNKTRYRGIIKHTLQALARCAWINMRRLFLFDVKLTTQIA